MLLGGQDRDSLREELTALLQDPTIINLLHNASDYTLDPEGFHHTLGIRHDQTSYGDHTHDGNNSLGLSSGYVDLTTNQVINGNKTLVNGAILGLNAGIYDTLGGGQRALGFPGSAGQWSTDAGTSDLVLRTNGGTILFNLNGGSGASSAKLNSTAFTTVVPIIVNGGFGYGNAAATFENSSGAANILVTDGTQQGFFGVATGVSDWFVGTNTGDVAIRASSGTLIMNGRLKTTDGAQAQFGGAASTGFYVDATNVAVRGSNTGGSIYFQGPGGSGTSMLYTTATGVLSGAAVVDALQIKDNGTRVWSPNNSPPELLAGQRVVGTSVGASSAASATAFTFMTTGSNTFKIGRLYLVIATCYATAFSVAGDVFQVGFTDSGGLSWFSSALYHAGSKVGNNNGIVHVGLFTASSNINCTVSWGMITRVSGTGTFQFIAGAVPSNAELQIIDINN